MMHKKTIGWIAAAAIVAVAGVVLVLAVNGHFSGKQERETGIGAILPMTGGAAYVGQSCREGMELATVQFKEAHPDGKIRLLVEDSANDPKTGLNALRKLRDVSNVPIIACVMSAVAEAVLTQFPEQPSLLSVVSQSRSTLNRPNTFRYFLSSDKETGAMANFLVKKGAKRAAFLYVNDEFGLDALECFTRHYSSAGGNVVIRESFEKTGSQLADIITKTLAANPEAIFFAGYGAPIAIIAQRLRESNYTGHICSFSSFMAPAVIKQAGNAANGVFVTTTSFDPTNPGTPEQTRFVEAYSAKYGRRPDHYAAYSYDLISIFLQSWSAGGYKMDRALEEMKNIRAYKGVIGVASCDKNRDFQFPVGVKVVADGKLVNL